MTVRVTDDGMPALDDSTTFQIIVAEVNQAPAGQDNAYATGEDTILAVAAPGVLGNDTDPDIPVQTLVAILETSPVYGMVALSPDGSFVYTPTLNFHGVDGFSYSVSDGELADTAMVTLTVEPAICDLVLAKTASDSEVVLGAVLSYTLTVTNAGPGISSAITVTDWLPAGMAWISASPGCVQAAGQVMCVSDSLPPGATVAFTLTARVEMTATGVLTNTAEVSGAELDPDPTNNIAFATVELHSHWVYLPLVVRTADGDRFHMGR